MKKEVQITIKSDIKTEDNRDNIELTVNGTAYTKDNCYYLCYKESDESGFEFTINPFEVKTFRII